MATTDVRAIDGLALGSDSSIYFTDGASLRRLLANGTVVTIAEALTRPSWGEDLMGLEVDARGVAYVADYSGARVLKVDTDGLTSILFTSRWPWSPTGLARTSDAMVVLEHLRMPFVLLGNVGVGPYIRVLQVSADGAVTTRTTVWGRYSWALEGAVALGAAGAVAVRRRVTARRRAVSS